jgi:predicted nuclease of predicted toxin-antitoxin system
VPPDPVGPTLFIDRDAWSHHLDRALRAAGVTFVAHRDHFDDDTPDPDWLTQVGQRGWIVLTRDQRIRNRPNELRAARNARLHVFALTSGNLPAAEAARLVLAAWPAIQRAVADTEPPSFWSITRGGAVKALKR